MKRNILFLGFVVLIFQGCAEEVKSTVIPLGKEKSMTVQIIDFGGVNGYLVKTGGSFFMIDNGFSYRRAELEQELSNAGCVPGNLKLVLLTHGDIDHVNNSAYLREKYGAKIAMHRDDSEMVETGNMGLNRKANPDRDSWIFHLIIFFGRKEKFETFKPDIYVEDGQSLSEYGFDAQILHLKEHSKGSIGILTADGDLFCGDLLINFDKPDYHFMIWDMPTAKAAVERLKTLPIKTFYPGHGKPFSKQEFLKSFQ